MSEDKMVLTYDEMCKLNDKWDTIVKERDKQSATLRKRIAELEAQIEAMRCCLFCLQYDKTVMRCPIRGEVFPDDKCDNWQPKGEKQ